MAAPRRRTKPTRALATTNFDAIRHGVMALSVSGDPHAQIVITALQNNRLYMRPDKALFIKNADGTFIDALTGAASDVPAGALKPVRVNNAVRSAIDAALGVLRLFAPDASTRLAAAEAVFAGARSGRIAGVGQSAGEGNRCHGQTPDRAGACRGLLSSPDAADADRLAAIAILRARGDLEARSTLGNLTGQSPAGRRRRRQRDHRHRSQPATLVVAGERLLRHQPRLGAAARRCRPGDHLRRHGRHQHGARRDGDDRRLCHLHGAAGAEGVSAVDLPGQFAARHSAGVHRRRPDRHRHRAYLDPLAVRPAAGDLARHLGPVAGVATGGADRSSAPTIATSIRRAG